MKDSIEKAVVIVLSCVSTIVELIKIVTKDDGGEENGSSS